MTAIHPGFFGEIPIIDVLRIGRHSSPAHLPWGYERLGMKLSFQSLSDPTEEKMQRPPKDSVLFVTLDSCRYDTFARSQTTALSRVGALHKAQAPSYFTYGSHSAMFVGFTPGIPGAAVPILDPKWGKLFKLTGTGFPAKGEEGYQLVGRNIVDGFRNRGFATIGAAAMGWFDPSTPTGRHLSDSFEKFTFTGNFGLAKQVEFVTSEMEAEERDVFAFINVGETHVPYWHEGAAWSQDDNPCVPFQNVDRSVDCRFRQGRCLEYADRLLAPLLDRFSESTIIVCGDHGDCWGENGIWEHGVSHWATLTVPLLVRVRGQPVTQAMQESLGRRIRTFVQRRLGGVSA